ncbi:MAG TPA: T9SS type A sorting domain-containing protein [Flavobacteriaceae bacterium]|nr:T9SS type A sorting domain-containing protein [Flavobacteriaceae bacterium]
MGMSSNLTIDVTAANGGQEVVLPAGEYWVSAFPTIEMSDPMWYWLGSTVNLPYPSVLIDPDDLFGDGMTDWTEISTLIDEDFPSFSWTMMGEEMLSTENNVLAGVSIYPNPSTDVLNISAPANVDVESVTLYDVLGKSVNADFNNGTVNISALANGIYVLQVKTSEGILTQKVVKN